MRIEFVAFDSFGIKSSCIRVETEDIAITVDPGIAGEVRSFPLPDHEKKALYHEYKKKIKNACIGSDCIVITHYHYDHFIDERSEMYENKILFIKDPEKNINRSQKDRSAHFLCNIKGLPSKIKIADEKKFNFGNTKIEFSHALWHGVKGTRLGKVVMAVIEDEEKRLVYTSDLDGPYIEEYADLIVNKNPDILIMDSYPSYLLGFIASFKNLLGVIKNTIKILERSDARVYVLDHHLLRDYRYPDLYYEVYKKAKELGKKVCTAAELQGKEPKVLEGYKKYGSTRWRHWDRMTFEKLKKIIREVESKRFSR